MWNLKFQPVIRLFLLFGELVFGIVLKEQGGDIKQQNHTFFTVSDNGVGMSEETRNNIFKLDTTVIKNGTDHERGSGLGLILCKEFVEKHGGKIWAESGCGKGSKFEFTIPSSIK
jgi:signal transduction histidine kinase